MVWDYRILFIEEKVGFSVFFVGAIRLKLQKAVYNLFVNVKISCMVYSFILDIFYNLIL